MRFDASGSATQNSGRYCCTGASSWILPASTSCMTANAVNDLLIDPILKGVVTVTAPSSLLAEPKVCRWTTSPSLTMPSAAPGIRRSWSRALT
jgi:hypothetical protein